MPIETERYESQVARWPDTGRVILAQFDADTVVVYQAYRRSIARYALRHGQFGGDFKLGRMTWIKPNFLWMMYRSSWGTSSGQEWVLGIRLERAVFEEILRSSVHSSFRPAVYADESAWRERLSASDVRLQWDPDHAPGGAPVARRAIQLGLRGDASTAYAREWIVGIEDMTDLVAEGRAAVEEGDLARLETPREEPYPVPDDVAAHLEMVPGGDA